MPASITQGRQHAHRPPTGLEPPLIACIHCHHPFLPCREPRAGLAARGAGGQYRDLQAAGRWALRSTAPRGTHRPAPGKAPTPQGRLGPVAPRRALVFQRGGGRPARLPLNWIDESCHSCRAPAASTPPPVCGACRCRTDHIRCRGSCMAPAHVSRGSRRHARHLPVPQRRACLQAQHELSSFPWEPGGWGVNGSTARARSLARRRQGLRVQARGRARGAPPPPRRPMTLRVVDSAAFEQPAFRATKGCSLSRCTAAPGRQFHRPAPPDLAMARCRRVELRVLRGSNLRAVTDVQDFGTVEPQCKAWSREKERRGLEMARPDRPTRRPQ
jgi:hypothetical protein